LKAGGAEPSYFAAVLLSVKGELPFFRSFVTKGLDRWGAGLWRMVEEI
jgi:hypothetical protein